MVQRRIVHHSPAVVDCWSIGTRGMIEGSVADKVCFLCHVDMVDSPDLAHCRHLEGYSDSSDLILVEILGVWDTLPGQRGVGGRTAAQTVVEHVVVRPWCLHQS